MSYTLGEAARATGLNKTTVLKAIRTGKISGMKDEHGQWSIEPCELHRVYPPRSEATGADNEHGNDGQPTNIEVQLAELRAYKQFAEERLTELKALCEDMRMQRDKWQAAHAQLALTGPKTGEKPEQNPQKPAMTWWRWLRSTG